MRIKQAKEVLVKNKLDAIVLFSKSPSFRYLLGEKLDSGMIILTRKNAILFVNSLYKSKPAGFKVVIYDKLIPELKEVIKKYKIKKTGIDENYTFVRQKKFINKYFKTIDVSEKLDFIRQEKLPEEMKRIRTACNITDEVFSLILKNFKDFKTEQDISRFIQVEFIKRDCELAFDSIVASGKNAAVAHHHPQDALNKGFLVIDFGAKYKGYCADMTRTVYIGKPNNEERKLYEKIMRINEDCIQIAKPGMAAKDLHNRAVELFGTDAKYFIHSIGHGFGVEVHEMPSMYPKSKDKLKINSVITIEPGYYNENKNLGIRIEDDVFLGKKKEVLTKSSKKLICL